MHGRGSETACCRTTVHKTRCSDTGCQRSSAGHKSTLLHLLAGRLAPEMGCVQQALLLPVASPAPKWNQAMSHPKHGQVTLTKQRQKKVSHVRSGSLNWWACNVQALA